MIADFANINCYKITEVTEIKFMKKTLLRRVKGCVYYIFAGLLCMFKREHFKNKGKCFLLHFESSFRS